MDNSTNLATEMEAAAAALGMSPSTIGREAGQGGRFYARIKGGARHWPETREKVMNTIAALRLKRAAETSGAAE